jgi:hypothetical protein
MDPAQKGDHAADQDGEIGERSQTLNHDQDVCERQRLVLIGHVLRVEIDVDRCRAYDDCHHQRAESDECPE